MYRVSKQMQVVIPAHAGIQMQTVIPAHAGIQMQTVIPAHAGIQWMKFPFIIMNFLLAGFRHAPE